jgi:hypothetical protein
MIRTFIWQRLGGIALLVAGLVTAFSAGPMLAQETPTTAPAMGTVTVLTTVCTRDDQAEGTITVVAGGGTSGLACSPGDPVSLSIDGGEPINAANGDQIPLPAGAHSIAETTQASTLTVDIVENSETVIEVTTAVAPVAPTETATNTPEPTATETAAGSVRVVSHICDVEVELPELQGLDWAQQLLACPALALPGNYGDVPAADVSANDPDNPLPYDLTLEYESGDATTLASLADATFKTAHVCESDLGGNLNGVATDNRCWDLSGYQVDDVLPGAVAITATDLPKGYNFGLARTDPASDDGAALGAVDPGAGTVQLDTSGDGAVTLHLFHVSEPVTNEIAIVSHLCGAGVDSRSAFNAIGDHWAKINACPSIVLTGNTPAPDSLSNGARDFAIEVEGADFVPQQLAAAGFEQRRACEADLPVDINGDTSDNICLDLSAYEFANVLQGSPVTIRSGSGPSGSIFLGTSFVPGSGDDSTQLSVGTRGTIKLDTTANGHVTIHVYYGPEPPPTPTPAPTRTPTKTPASTPTNTPAAGGSTATPTRAPTRTPTPSGPTATPTVTSTPLPGTGSLQIFKFWCEGAESLTRINALAPGADATRSDLGDLTCANGNSDFVISDANGNQIQTVSVPPIGILFVGNLPAASYGVRDTFSGATGQFQIQSGVVTKVISLQYEEVYDIPDPPDFTPIDLPDNPAETAVIPGFDDDGNEDFDFGGPVAVPDGSDPFTVIDDPEAQARVSAIDSFEELPGVGIGDDGGDRSLPWVALLMGGIIALAGIRVARVRPARRRI